MTNNNFNSAVAFCDQITGNARKVAKHVSKIRVFYPVDVDLAQSFCPEFRNVLNATKGLKRVYVYELETAKHVIDFAQYVNDWGVENCGWNTGKFGVSMEYNKEFDAYELSV